MISMFPLSGRKIQSLLITVVYMTYVHQGAIYGAMNVCFASWHDETRKYGHHLLSSEALSRDRPGGDVGSGGEHRRGRDRGDRERATPGTSTGVRSRVLDPAAREERPV